MINYLKTTQIKDSPFIMLDKPVRVYKMNYQAHKEKAYENYALPQNMTLYLINEELAPWELVKDDNDEEIYNLIYFKYSIIWVNY